MKFDIFRRLLRKTPINIGDNKESLLCLDYDFSLIPADAFMVNIDSSNVFLGRTPSVILPSNRKTRNRFPTHNIEEPFYSLDFNKMFFDKFDLAKLLFLKQSSIKDYLISQIQRNDFLALIVIDGLSFLDCKHWGNVRPCLVDTVTNTQCGFKNIICNGKSIAYNLFKKGFLTFNGYSYWEKEQKNELTDLIFAGFNTVTRFEAYSEVISDIGQRVVPKSYHQIVMQGLDGLAHHHRDEPMISALVDNIEKRILDTVTEFKNTGLKGLVCVTSDHGILWKHRSNLIKIPSHTSFDNYHQRYYDSKILSKDCRNFQIDGKNFSSLKFPYILRNMRTNEWGVHGGVSLEESIVPFLNFSINA